MNTENHYQETDLGNVSPNPRGEYTPGTEYEYLDLVTFDGGSYICVAELGTTTSISPESGKNTDFWQCMTIPGDMTSEYVAMHDRVVNLSEQVESDAEEVRVVEQNVSGMKENVTQMQEQTRQSAESAERSKDSAAGYADSADASRQAAETSEQNINAQVAGFDAHVDEKTSEAEQSVEASRIVANKSILAQQEQSVNEVARVGIEAVSTAQAAAQTATEKAQAAATSEKNAAASETAAKLSEENATKMAEQVATDKEQVAYDRTAVENAKQEMTGSVAQIEQNTQGITELKGELVKKIDNPTSADNNKFPRAKNGNVEWVEQGLPTDEQTETAVQNWLNTHPEATTTVDYTITTKVYNNIQSMVEDTSVKVGSSCRTLYARSSGGGGLYIIRQKNNNDVDDGFNTVFLDNGLVAVRSDTISNMVVYLSSAPKLVNETLGDCLKRYAEKGNITIMVDCDVEITSKISLADNTNIIGTNNSITLTVASDMDSVIEINESCTHCVISHLTFYGNYEKYSVSKVIHNKTTDSENHYFQSCYLSYLTIMAFTGVGIVVEANALGITMNNVHVQYCNEGGLIINGHDIILNDFTVFGCGKASGAGFGVKFYCGGSKITNGKIYVNGHNDNQYTNFLGGIGSQYTSLEFQENTAGVLSDNALSCQFNISCDKNNVAEKENATELTLVGTYYSIFNITFMARAIAGIPSTVGLKLNSGNANTYNLTKDGSSISELYKGNILMTSDKVNKIFNVGYVEFEDYTNASGGTIKYMGDGVFEINGTFNTDTVPLYASYSNRKSKNFGKCSVVFETDNNSASQVVFVPTGSDTPTYYSAGCTDVSDLEFGYIMVKFDMNKSYAHRFFKLYIIKKNGAFATM